MTPIKNIVPKRHPIHKHPIAFSLSSVHVEFFISAHSVCSIFRLFTVGVMETLAVSIPSAEIQLLLLLSRAFVGGATMRDLCLAAITCMATSITQSCIVFVGTPVYCSVLTTTTSHTCLFTSYYLLR